MTDSIKINLTKTKNAIILFSFYYNMHITRNFSSRRKGRFRSARFARCSL